MKCLKRNMTDFEYCAYTGLESDLNEDGLHTGVPHPIYDAPVHYKGNISSPSGRVSQAFDGLEIMYSHVLVMDQPDVDINEAGKIKWKGKAYDVIAVRPSINFTSIALREHTIADHGDQYVDEPPESDGE